MQVNLILINCKQSLIICPLFHEFYNFNILMIHVLIPVPSPEISLRFAICKDKICPFFTLTSPTPINPHFLVAFYDFTTQIAPSLQSNG